MASLLTEIVEDGHTVATLGFVHFIRMRNSVCTHSKLAPM